MTLLAKLLRELLKFKNPAVKLLTIIDYTFLMGAFMIYKLYLNNVFLKTPAVIHFYCLSIVSQFYYMSIHKIKPRDYMYRRWCQRRWHHIHGFHVKCNILHFKKW